MDEAVNLFLVSAADIGALEDILQEAGHERRQEKMVIASYTY